MKLGVDCRWIQLAEAVLNVVSVVAAVLSACYWVGSARVPLPNITAGTTYDGTGVFPDALEKQARRNARAATWAAVAAGCQAAVILLRL
jgi:hypothetical protein